MLKDTLIDYDPATGRVSNLPQQVFLELTGKCNLACVHCSKDYGLPESKDELHMSAKVIERIDHVIQNARFLNLNLVGEPMMAPEFRNVIRRARQGNAEISFNTNALFMDDEMARFLVEHDVNSIAISFDGTKFNKRVRGVPYEAILKRMEIFEKVRKELNSEQPHLALAYTLFKDNIHELPELLREVLPKVRIHAVHVQPLIVFYETLRDQNVYAAPTVDAVIQECREICAKYGSELVLFRSQFVQDERAGAAQELVRELGPFSEKFGCTDPFFEIKIRADGTILACSYGREANASVLTHDFDKLWNSEWYCDLRKKLYAQDFDGQCKGCPYLFGSLENQLTPMRPGVEHSKHERFVGKDSASTGKTGS